jgi:hypothetical protein
MSALHDLRNPEGFDRATLTNLCIEAADMIDELLAALKHALAEGEWATPRDAAAQGGVLVGWLADAHRAIAKVEGRS